MKNKTLSFIIAMIAIIAATIVSQEFKNQIWFWQVFVLSIWFVFFFVEDKVHKIAPWLDDIKATAITGIILYFLGRNSSNLDSNFSLEHSVIDSGKVIVVLSMILIIVHAIERLGIIDILERLKTGHAKKDHKRISWSAFGMSAVIDNVAATDASISSQDLTKKKNIIAMNAVNASNAGGAASCVGDSTTLYLWQQELVHPGMLLLFFLPAAVNNWVTTKITGVKVEDKKDYFDKNKVPLNKRHLFASIIALLMIPILKLTLHLEVHEAAVIAGLFMLTYFAIFSGKSLYKSKKPSEKLSHFYGTIKPAILMALIVFQMTQLSYSGLLGEVGLYMQSWHIIVVIFTLGILSILVDNMAVVAMSAQAMKFYPAGAFFWYALAYSAGTAGSLNLPGSSAGVTLKKRTEEVCHDAGIEPTITTMSFFQTVGFANLSGWISGLIVITIMYYTIGFIF